MGDETPLVNIVARFRSWLCKRFFDSEILSGVDRSARPTCGGIQLYNLPNKYFVYWHGAGKERGNAGCFPVGPGCGHSSRRAA